MKSLLDTNVVSELRLKTCSPNVKAWIDSIANDDLFISAASVGEITYGIQKLPDGKKRTELTHWFDNIMLPWFKDRIISLDVEIMREWGALCARHKRTLSFMDSLLASTAISRNLILVTRNVADFEDIAGLRLLNPWDYH